MTQHFRDVLFAIRLRRSRLLTQLLKILAFVDWCPAPFVLQHLRLRRIVEIAGRVCPAETLHGGGGEPIGDPLAAFVRERRILRCAAKLAHAEIGQREKLLPVLLGLFDEILDLPVGRAGVVGAEICINPADAELIVECVRAAHSVHGQGPLERSLRVLVLFQAHVRQSSAAVSVAGGLRCPQVRFYEW